MATIVQSDEEEFERKASIARLLPAHFGREVLYISKGGKHSNNFVYYVTLTSEVSSSVRMILKNHGCSALSPSTLSVVFRISNPGASLDKNIRIQNEVASLELCRAAFASYPRGIIPEVYGWNSASDDGYGWILEETIKGEPLDGAFDSLLPSEQRVIVEQMASILKLIQDFPLPSGVKSYGGLCYGSEGQILSGSITFGFGGDKVSTIIQGLPNQQLTLVHGDLDLHNILFYPKALQITALLDFDFAHIASPLDEYFYSLQTIHGILLSSLANEGDNVELLRCFLLDGETELPDTSEDVNWTLARRLQEELAKACVVRPGTFGKESNEAIGEIAALYWFIQDVCPHYLLGMRYTASMTPEQKKNVTARVQETLERYLDRWGY